MTDHALLIILACIASVAPTILSIATLIQGIRTHRTFNSRMEEMIELTRSTAYKKGRKDEQDTPT